jgi:hypothetical protein
MLAQKMIVNVASDVLMKKLNVMTMMLVQLMIAMKVLDVLMQE